MYKYILLCFLFVSFTLTAAAQSARPTMSVVQADGTESDETAFDGSAPMTAVFRAHPENVGSYTPRYEWRFTRQGQTEAFLVRYDEETTFTFNESGQFAVTLYVTFTQGTDTVQYVTDTPFTVTISESKLEFPNAFSPNGDGINDILRAKDGYKSIVSFEAAVYNRSGRRLYSWTDPAGGWDGRSGGHDVPDGAYYLVVKARGADGRNYNIRKVVSILRGYSEKSSGGVGN